MRPNAGTYRADIDGLRAVAVIAVILFHVGIATPGGFIGVDVFFVISGFLITYLVAKDLDAGTFSLVGFWTRRIRRIWPASLAVTGATLVAGWFLMLPGDFRSLADDALAQIAMVANVRYWRSVYYFGIAAEFRPLLHTWSLAVEEQFYVFYPLLMIAAWRGGRRACSVIVIALAAISLTVSSLLLENRASFVFYMLPFRAWEMLLGGAVALMPTPSFRARRVTEALGTAGALLVSAPLVLYDRATPFPGMHAIPPCAGAAMIIAAGTTAGGSWVNRFLATPPLRAVGLMSYSLYLWHWPLLAFLRYLGRDDLIARHPPLILMAIVVMASLSWRFIEQPFRRPRAESDSFLRVACTAAAVSFALGGCCLWIRRADGVPQRFSPAVLRLLANADKNDDRERFLRDDGTAAFPRIGAAASAGSPCLFVWGDSHTLSLAAVIDAVARDLGVGGEVAIRPGVPPLPDVWRPNATFNKSAGKHAAREWFGRAVDRIRTIRPRHVILCARWSCYMQDRATALEDPTIAPLEATGASASTAVTAMQIGLRRMREICAEVGAELWVCAEVPDQTSTQSASISRRAFDLHWSGRPPTFTGVSRAVHALQQRAVRTALDGSGDAGIHVIDLAEPFFDDEGISHVGHDQTLWYEDSSHVTAAGAREVLAPFLHDVLSRMAEGCGSVRRGGLESPVSSPAAPGVPLGQASR